MPFRKYATGEVVADTETSPAEEQNQQALAATQREEQDRDDATVHDPSQPQQ